MPRVTLDPFERKRRETSAWIKGGIALEGIATMKELAKRTGIPESTMNMRVRKPETLRLDEIWRLEKVIGKYE